MINFITGKNLHDLSLLFDFYPLYQLQLSDIQFFKVDLQYGQS